ncbi:DUF167 domain-containing protein [Kibdelosporangium lantanae]|uniref:UPF0235 protein ACFQ1S_22110 n=1 Tax=Kibdelosporangium lantanae TaxID=1497396 RepID=A0ABW3MBL5_9PSEU
MGFRFAVRVRPGARREAVGGSRDGNALTVAVTAPAIKGRANEAVCSALAKAFGVRARDVSVVAGGRGRDKVVELDPAPTDAAERLKVLLAQGI